jgi:coenzyme F420 hydrogenase subunit delta
MRPATDDGSSVLSWKVLTRMTENESSVLPEYCTKEILVLGCGNRLFGDDGFGSIVAEHLLADYTLPVTVHVADAGTGVRKLLFTLCLSPERPRRIIIVDAVDKGRTPGELFEISLDEIPLKKLDDFSLHQAPSSNLAKELAETGVEVRILACQVGYIPEAIQPGLTEPVALAVQRTCDCLAAEWLSDKGTP